jgi:hypothetical protein
VLIPLLFLVEADVTLTAIALGVSLRGWRTGVTIAASALVATGIAVAMVLIWVLWLVAPGCLGDPNPGVCVGGRVGGAGLLYASEIALIQWFWMLGVALCARFVAERNLAHVSG